MFNKIPSGTFNTLAKLTSRMNKNSQMRIYERYKLYDKALTKSGLDPKIFPNLKEIWTKVDASKTNNDTKREKRSGGQRHNT